MTALDTILDTPSSLATVGNLQTTLAQQLQLSRDEAIQRLVDSNAQLSHRLDQAATIRNLGIQVSALQLPPSLDNDDH